MSFNFYFVGPDNQQINSVVPELNSNVLYSYYTHRSTISKMISLRKEGKWNGKLLVDSGAFTSWTRGVNICPDDYIKWINENAPYVDYFIQLDSIPGKPNNPVTLEESKLATEETWQNYLYMLEKVVCPEKILPVYHKGEPLSQLKKIIEHEHNGKMTEYVCLGGLAKTKNKNEITMFMDKCWGLIEKSKNPKIKTHYLGCANTKVLEVYPFYSSDSTSWRLTSAFGSILTEYGPICISDRRLSEFQHIDNLSPLAKKEIDKLCEAWKIDYEDLRKHIYVRHAFNMHYLVEWTKKYQYKGPKSFIKKSLF